MEHGVKLHKDLWTKLSDKEYSRSTSCARCAGLLVSDWFYDLENPGEYHVKGLRCVQCGHRVDATIAHNRVRPPVVHNREARSDEEDSMNTRHWEDAAVSG
jgi:hypothetical protein